MSRSARRAALLAAAAVLSAGTAAAHAAPAATTASSSVSVSLVQVSHQLGTLGLHTRLAAKMLLPKGDRVAGWTVNFGDGTHRSGTRLPRYWDHTYVHSGIRSATLSVTDARHHKAHATLHVGYAGPDYTAPHVTLTTNPSGGYGTVETGQPVTFTFGGTGWGGARLTLAFGDGTAAATGGVLSHSYSAPGTYSVVASARDANGAIAHGYAVMRVMTPTSFTIVPVTATSADPSTQELYSTAMGATFRIFGRFPNPAYNPAAITITGDAGTTVTPSTVVAFQSAVRFSTPGPHTVTATGTDSFGAVHTGTLTVQVDPPAAATAFASCAADSGGTTDTCSITAAETLYGRSVSGWYLELYPVGSTGPAEHGLGTFSGLSYSGYTRGTEYFADLQLELSDGQQVDAPLLYFTPA